MIKKESSGRISASAIVWRGACYYYGFTCIPGGADRTIVLYDALSATGKRVDDFIADGAKKTDGHSHAIPVKCTTGLYVSMTGGNVVVFFQPIGTA